MFQSAYTTDIFEFSSACMYSRDAKNNERFYFDD